MLLSPQSFVTDQRWHLNHLAFSICPCIFSKLCNRHIILSIHHSPDLSNSHLSSSFFHTLFRAAMSLQGLRFSHNCANPSPIFCSVAHHHPLSNPSISPPQRLGKTHGKGKSLWNSFAGISPSSPTLSISLLNSSPMAKSNIIFPLFGAYKIVCLYFSQLQLLQNPLLDLLLLFSGSWIMISKFVFVKL